MCMLTGVNMRDNVCLTDLQILWKPKTNASKLQRRLCRMAPVLLLTTPILTVKLVASTSPWPRNIVCSVFCVWQFRNTCEVFHIRDQWRPCSAFELLPRGNSIPACQQNNTISAHYRWRISTCTSCRIRSVVCSTVSAYLVRFKKNFEEPDLKEGFQEIVKVNFVAQFQSEKEKKLFQQYAWAAQPLLRSRRSRCSCDGCCVCCG